MFLLLLCHSFSNIHVNELNIRLPFCRDEKNPPSFVLTADVPKAHWETPDEGVIKLIKRPSTKYNSSVVVQVLHKGPNSNGAIISVSHSGKESTINVYIDEIHKIQLETTTQILYYNTSMDVYSIKAYDREGNVFSSISGYIVDWTYDPKHIVEVPLKDTDLSNNYPEGSLPNNEIIIKGIKLGKTALTAQIRDTKIRTQEVSLDIVFPIYLYPREINVLPGVQYQAKLCSGVGIDKSKYGQSCDKPVTDLEAYQFKSDKKDLADVSPHALISSKKKGSTYVRVHHIKNPLSKGQMRVNVLEPAKVKIPDEWIIVGSKPTCKGFEIFDSAQKKIHSPEDIVWDLEGDYSTLGAHKIKASAYGVVGYFTVYVCDPIRFEKDQVILPKGYKGYQPRVLGGSDPKYHQRSGEVAESLSDYTITVYDKKLDMKITQKVIVEECVQPIIDFDSHEAPVGETVGFTIKGKSKSGKLFDFIQIVGDPVSSNPEVATVDKGKMKIKFHSSGFSDIKISLIGGSVSGKFSGFRHVKVNTLVNNARARIPINIGLKDGPLHWPGAKQFRTVRCGPNDAEIDHDGHLVLKSHYSGQCHVSVVNQKTEENPNPYTDIANFNVSADSISRYKVIPFDAKSSDFIGFVPSLAKAAKIDTVESQYYIARMHIPEFKYYAYNQDGRLIGEFNNADQKFVGVTDSGMDYVIGSPIIENVTFTYSVPGLDAPEYRLKLIVVAPFDFSKSKLILYSHDEGKKIDFIGGSGSFDIIESSDIAENKGSFMIVKPSKDNRRNVTVRDKAIPEFVRSLEVHTKIPDRLHVDGPRHGVINEQIRISIEIKSKDDETIEMPDHNSITCNSTDVRKEDSGHFTFTPREVGQYVFRFYSQDNSNIKHYLYSIDIAEKIAFNESGITMFVGEVVNISIIGGSGSQILYNSSDDSVVRMQNHSQFALGISPGEATIKAYCKEKPVLGVATIKVRILQIKATRIELDDKDDIIVGSIHRFYSIVETDIGDRSPKYIQWNVTGPDNYELRYDNSIVIKPTSPGPITIKCWVHTNHEDVTSSNYCEMSVLVKPKLVVEPKKITVPVGGSERIQIHGNLDVNYTIQEIESYRDGVSVSSDGYLTARRQGEYIVIVRSGSQVESVLVVVSKPSGLYLEVVREHAVKPHLLDNNRVPYSAHSDIVYDYNFSDFTNISDGSYSFPVDGPTIISGIASVSSGGWRVQNETMVYSHKQIIPENPVLVKGASVDFICSHKKPVWYSTNKLAMPIGKDGSAIAQRKGRTTIYCSDIIRTQAKVVTLDEILITEAKLMERYNIQTILDDGYVDASTAIFPKDHRLACSWDAPRCGSIYAVDATNISSAYCKIDLYKEHNCPSNIKITVRAESSKYDNNVVIGEYTINNIDNIFGTPSLITLTITKKRRQTVVPIRPSENEVSIQNGDPRLKVYYTSEPTGPFKHTGIVVEASDDFVNGGTNKPATIKIVHNKSGSVLIINVINDKKKWISFWRHRDGSSYETAARMFSLASGVVFIVLITCSVGTKGLLPPLSPYRLPN